MAFSLLDGFADPAEFFEAFDEIAALLTDPELVLRAVDEATEDAAGDGVVYVEYSLTVADYVEAFGSEDAALDAMTERASQAGRRFGVEVAFMPLIDRGTTTRAAEEIARIAARYAGRGVSSLGLAGDERTGRIERFSGAFAFAREYGLKSAPHAGEFGGPHSVRTTLEHLQPNRIQHGVTAMHDPTVVRRLAESDICLDICPSSNVALGAVTSWETHPLGGFLDAGVPCSLGADDPILFGVGILDEYENARSRLALDDDALAMCARNSIVHSSASDLLKRDATVEIDLWAGTRAGSL